MNYEFEITRRCNFKCPGCNRLCNLLSGEGSDVSLEETANIVEQINSLNKRVGRFTIMGGEPTLNPNSIEICKYVKENLHNCGGFLLATNHTNDSISEEISKIGYRVLFREGHVSPAEVAAKKARRHWNILLSPKELGLRVKNPRHCDVLNYCGISMHKYKGKIKWLWCGPGTSVCKLLMKEDIMKDTLEELINSDKTRFFEEVCKNCAGLSPQSQKAINTPGEISECFKEGLERLKEDN